MDAASDIPGSPVAWNGIFLTVPDDWIPAIIDTRHILFTRHNIAVLECKWTAESGPVSIPRKCRALEKQMQRHEGFSLTSADIPARWNEMLQGMSSDFEVHPFTHAEADGAFCLHKPSNSTLFIQCPNTEARPDTQPDGQPDVRHDTRHDVQPDVRPDVRSAVQPDACSGAQLGDVLRSIGMVMPGVPVPYALNDLQFLAPAGYALRNAEFKPGLSEILFSDGQCELCIRRFAPANVVLQGQPFRVWIQETMETPLKDIRKEKTGLPAGARKRYQWHRDVRPNLLQRLSLFSSGTRRIKTIRGTAWVEEHENKLLMVTHESSTTTTCNAETFESVWRSLRVR
jgi:hypothetical protein